MMVLCACSLHAQRNISNTDGIVYSTPISVLDVMDMGGTGTITNVAKITAATMEIKPGVVAATISANGAGELLLNATASADVRVYGGLSIGGTADTLLRRDAANTLAQRNGVNAQTSRIYGSYTDSSNYERLSLSHDGSGVGTIAVESSGTGASAQSLKLQVAGNGALYVDGDTAGNARGAGAVDLQISRASAERVASGESSILIGGSGNRATSLSSFSLGGTGSIASGSYASTINSQGSTASGNAATILGGYANTASGGYSTILSGYQSTASGNAAVVSGIDANGYLWRQRAYSSGKFSALGDAQGSRLVARNTTSGTTPSDLFLDGVDDRLVLPANTSWGFTVSVVGRTTDAGTGAEQSAYYELKGLIKRDGASNTTLVGSVTKTVLAEDDATWDVDVTADDTNEALDIAVTGGTGDNVRWVATIQLTEVGG